MQKLKLKKYYTHDKKGSPNKFVIDHITLCVYNYWTFIIFVVVFVVYLLFFVGGFVVVFLFGSFV